MVTITFTEQDLLRIQMIDVDRDADEALAFVRERLLPEIKSQQGQRMTGHLDGGKGSML